MKRYAEHFGMTFREVVDSDFGRPPAWSKLYLTQKCFDEGFDCVFWVDADAVFRRFDEDIRSVVTDDADFYFARERHRISNTPSFWRLNTGVYVMKNTPDSRRLLDLAIAREEYINHEWWDQAAISAIFGYWSVFCWADQHKPDDPTELTRKIGWLESKWNSSPVYDPEPNAIIHHFYGLRGRGKVAAMQIDAAIDDGGERSEAASRAVTKVLRIFEPYLIAGMPPVGATAEANLRRAFKFLRRRPWCLWFGRDRLAELFKDQAG